MALTGSRSSADPGKDGDQVHTFCRVCFWVSGAFFAFWAGVILWALML